MASRLPRHSSTGPGPSRSDKRRTLSQNFLHDRRAAVALCDQLEDSSLPVIELGAGAGAITGELVRRGFAVTAVELDPRWVQTLRRRFGASVHVVQSDMLRFRFPDGSHNIVSNVPYAITTALLRRLLSERRWDSAVLMVQWDVARKRSGSSLLTASWWPWYEIDSIRRVPASAFRPVPSVDSGILRLTRRPDPLLPYEQRRAYQHFVKAVFTGRGAGLGEILRRHVSRTQARHWMRQRDVSPVALPRELKARQWTSLYELAVARPVSSTIPARNETYLGRD